jgi:hypothetical protein
MQSPLRWGGGQARSGVAYAREHRGKGTKVCAPKRHESSAQAAVAALWRALV